MDSYSCPKGHTSSEPDFCSECGAKIAGNAGSMSAGAPAANGAASAAADCPDCKAPRARDGGDFCEVCGYNFTTGAHGDIAFAQPAPAPIADEPPTAASEGRPDDSQAGDAPVAAASPKWEVIAAIDPSLREAGSPEPPGHAGPFTFAIGRPVNLIGRHSQARAIEPEIPLDFDDAVSHRHAVISLGEDGALSVRDVGSANGTKLNGAALQPLADAALHDGDQLTLGHWTRLTVKAGD